MLSCKIIPKSRFLANLHRNASLSYSTQAANQAFTSSTHYIHTSGAQSKGKTARASHLYRVSFALNLDIESQGEADERRVKMRLHSSYPWPGRASDKGAWVQNGGTLLRSRLWLDCATAQDLGFMSQCVNTVVWAEGRLNRIAGDRLHIPMIRQLPHRGLYLLGTKVNNHNHRLLRRTSDSCLAR